LVLYRQTRYHLKEQRLAGKKPENSKELFNLRHASLRNVIERIFGVLKRKYQILRTPSEYSIDTQTRIILACTGLHNWVRSKDSRQVPRDWERYYCNCRRYTASNHVSSGVKHFKENG
jgi:transposase-like protein